MKRPKIGDVLEMRTSRGLAYAQYTHKNEKYGYLIRVINQLHVDRPTDLTRLMSQVQDYWQFVKLYQGLKYGDFTIIGNVPLPSEFQSFPIFRATNGRLNEKCDDWYFWDGEKEWRVKSELTPEQRKLSPRI